MGARESDDAEHRSVSVAARPGWTGERATEAGGRTAAATEEVEMAKAKSERLHGPAICGSFYGGNSSSPMFAT